MLLVALHDVTPVHAKRLLHAERLFAEFHIPAVTYLFIPNYHGRSPAHERADFLTWCHAPRPFEVEWFLHGYFHREDPGRDRHATLSEWCERTFMTAGEGEFLGLRGRALENRLRVGMESFERCFNDPPSGFVAPAWLYNDELLPALERADVAFTESHFHVFDLRNRRAVPSPVITWAARGLFRRTASDVAALLQRQLWRNSRVIRIALHPLDFDHPAIVDSVRRTIAALRENRQVVSYAAVSRPPP
ncbi:MAG TPA: DUF2334 domain-containing protein [Vicinamibacterales bacterium]|nr:DUF2334 domain-containing protein [Vicinamibacterales bacterium]